ncbi:MAG: lipid-binding SYLF domain-containing protein [Alphaproteobacteria bacterium]|nr:lipid-binding SYLF domain-containing protein [Alphaproteobacteria bacterium]
MADALNSQTGAVESPYSAGKKWLETGPKTLFLANPYWRRTMNYMHLLSSRLFPLVLLIGVTVGSLPAAAQDRTALDNDVHAAIALLLETTPAAKRLAETAKGALVFPNIVKAGFMVGVQYGNGALVRAKQGGGYYIAGYYNITSASYGLQLGIQTFGYVLALMTDAAIETVETSQGWELGVGPSIVVVDAGLAKTLTTKTAKSDVYAFTFGQKGLMAGLGLQGSKITRLSK